MFQVIVREKRKSVFFENKSSSSSSFKIATNKIAIVCLVVLPST